MGQNETSGTTEESLRFCRTVNRLTGKLREHSVDDFVRGMASQTAKSVSIVYDKDLTESFVYGATFPRANLQQIDIQRAAEYELNSYDNVRQGSARFKSSMIFITFYHFHKISVSSTYIYTMITDISKINFISNS